MRRRVISRTEHPHNPKLEIVRSRSSEKFFGTKKAKRVRFDDAEADDVSVRVSTRGHEGSQSPGSDAPKTSEYAYFRKLRNGAVHDYSHAVHKANRQSNSSKLNYPFRDNFSSSEVLKPSTKEVRFLFSVDREEPSDRRLFISPHATEYSEQDLTMVTGLTNETRKNPSLPFHNVTPVTKYPSSSSCHEIPKLSGADNQPTEKGIFAAKRQRLCQWAVQTLYPNVENPHPKGSDLVSSLLSRLFPKGNENDDLSKGDTDKSSSLILYEPNNLEKEPHLSCIRDWYEDHSKIYSGRPGEIVSLDWNELSSGFSFLGYGRETYAHNKSRDHDPHSKSQMCRITDQRHDFSFYLPFERFRSPGHFHFKGLDELNSVIEHPREEPCRLLLEWGKDHLDSTSINHDTAKTLGPRLTTWNVNQQQILDNMLGTEGLFSPSLFSHHCLEYNSLPNYGSTDFSTLEYGLNSDDVKFAMAEPGQFPLALPHTPQCITMAEDMLCDSNVIFSLGDQYWLKNKGQNDIHLGDSWWKCSSAGDSHAENSQISHPWDFPQGKDGLYSATGRVEALGELLDPLSEGTFNNGLLNSNLNSSFDTHINWPLLVNHVSQDNSDQVLFLDDDDSKLEYGYTL